jgi:hypothetical protein
MARLRIPSADPGFFISGLWPSDLLPVTASSGKFQTEFSTRPQTRTG